MCSSKQWKTDLTRTGQKVKELLCSHNPWEASRKPRNGNLNTLCHLCILDRLIPFIMPKSRVPAPGSWALCPITVGHGSLLPSAFLGPRPHKYAGQPGFTRSQCEWSVTSHGCGCVQSREQADRMRTCCSYTGHRWQCQRWHGRHSRRQRWAERWHSPRHSLPRGLLDSLRCWCKV